MPLFFFLSHYGLEALSLSTSLISRCSRLILCFLCPKPGIGHFYKEPCFLSGGYGLGLRV